MSELIKNLGIDWKLLLANGTTFFIVLWVLRKYAYKPLLKVIEDRQKTAAETVANSEQITARLDEIETRQQQVLAQAKSEAVNIIQAAKQEAEQARQRLVAAAENDAAGIMAKTKAAMIQEKEAMMAAAKNELADIVVGATRQVITEQLDADLQHKLAQRALKNLSGPRA